MTISHIELQSIYNRIFDDEIREGIAEFMKQDLDNPNYEYSTQMLWDVDSLIGGIGGYCMPADPTKNPFPAGIERELYRPLQYARSNIEICDARIFARYVIETCGMHLEAACRLLLKTIYPFGELRFFNTTLGKAVHKIEQQDIFEKEVIESLYDFVVVYNKSKHEINQDETRARMFNAYDAVVTYFAVRLLGIVILQKCGRKESFEEYRTDDLTEGKK